MHIIANKTNSFVKKKEYIYKEIYKKIMKN